LIRTDEAAISFYSSQKLAATPKAGKTTRRRVAKLFSPQTLTTCLAFIGGHQQIIGEETFLFAESIIFICRYLRVKGQPNRFPPRRSRHVEGRECGHLGSSKLPRPPVLIPTSLGERLQPANDSFFFAPPLGGKRVDLWPTPADRCRGTFPFSDKAVPAATIRRAAARCGFHVRGPRTKKIAIRPSNVVSWATPMMHGVTDSQGNSDVGSGKFLLLGTRRMAHS
jgi:hypothetical protein